MPRQLPHHFVGLFMICACCATSIFADNVQWAVDSNGDWNIGSNWSTGNVPVAGDDVTIDRPSVTVSVTQSSGNSVVNTLNAAENYSLMGGSLTVNGPSTLSADVTVNRASLIADGMAAALTASGTMTASNGTLAARNGAAMTLDNLTQFEADGSNNTNLLESLGSGSSMSLPSLSMIASTNAARITVEAESGGTLAVPALASISNANSNILMVQALGAGSVLDASAMTTAPAVRFNATGGGQLLLPMLSFAPSSSFSAQTGSVLQLPQLANHTVDGRVSTTVLESVGAGAVLDLSALTNIESTNAGRINLEAESGGITNLSALNEITNLSNNRLTALATGAGSHLDLSALANAQAVSFTAIGTATLSLGQLSLATNSGFSAQTGSEISLPQMNSYQVDGGASSVIWEATGTGAQLAASNLTNITSFNTGRLTLEAEAGGQLSLPALTSFNNTNNNNLSVTSTGAGSHVDLGSLASAQAIRFTAANQATMNLSQLTNATNSGFAAQQASELVLPQLTSFLTDGGSSLVLWEADGFGSALRMPALTSLSSVNTGRITIEAENGATVELSAVTNIANSNNNNVTLLASGGNSAIDLSALTTTQSAKFNAEDRGTINLSMLSNATNSSFATRSASAMDLPQLTSFITDGGSSTILWESTGFGSTLNFSGLTSITSVASGRLTMNAADGGTINLGSVSNIANSNNNLISITATGGESVVDLSALTNTQSARFTATNRGQLRLDQLTSATNSSFSAAGGSTVSLPAMTSYLTDGGSSIVNWTADGFASVLDATALTSITSAGTGRLNATATNGGTVNFGTVTSINNPNANILTFTSNGFDSQMNLSGVTTATAKFVVQDQGTMLLDVLSSANNSSFEVSSGSHLTVPQLASFVTDGSASLINWKADGFSAQLDFPALTAISSQGTGRLTIEALNSGQVNLPQLATVTNPNSNSVILRAIGLGSVVNATSLAQFAGRELDAQSGGTVNLPVGTVALTNTKVTVRSDGSQINGGAFQLGQDSSIVGDGTLTMDVTNAAGKVDPGAASANALLRIDGDYTQQTDGELEMDLAFVGATDLLQITGQASLSGLLDVDFASGTTFGFGDTITLLQADAGITGAFETVEGLTLNANQSLALIYNSNSVEGTVVLPGDANADGSVDGADFIAWNSAKFTASGRWTDGDFNADGFVDGQDFIIWNDNKFTSVTAFAVPEPAIGAALWLALVVSLRWRRNA